MEPLKREDGSWDGARILGVVFAVGGVVPFLVWLYELLYYVFAHHAQAEFSPALDPADIWYMAFPALGVGLGLTFGYGRELTNALIDRIRGFRKPDDSSSGRLG